jgi:MOSC domain-containing protein YiiM
MTQRGRLLGIATRPVRRAPMEEVPAACITLERGVNSDTRGKPGRRQVTLITSESWEKTCRDLSTALPWTTRRANLLVDGIDLEGKIGYDVQIGAAIVTITGETRPCQRMNEIHPGLLAALRPHWRGGVTARVKRAGDIRVGADVVLTRNLVRQWSLVVFYFARSALKRLRAFLGKVKRRVLQQQRAETPIYD